MGGLKLSNWLQTWTHAEVLGGTVAGFMLEQCLKDLFKNSGTYIRVTEESEIESKHNQLICGASPQTTTTPTYYFHTLDNDKNCDLIFQRQVH